MTAVTPPPVADETEETEQPAIGPSEATEPSATEPVATEPNPSAVGLIEICDPLSGRYGGNAGLVMFWHCGVAKMPELPPPSVSVKPTPQL